MASDDADERYAAGSNQTFGEALATAVEAYIDYRGAYVAANDGATNARDVAEARRRFAIAADLALSALIGELPDARRAAR